MSQKKVLCYPDSVKKEYAQVKLEIKSDSATITEVISGAVSRYFWPFYSRDCKSKMVLLKNSNLRRYSRFKELRTG